MSSKAILVIGAVLSGDPSTIYITSPLLCTYKRAWTALKRYGRSNGSQHIQENGLEGFPLSFDIEQMPLASQNM